jgi:hypothetical protein
MSAPIAKIPLPLSNYYFASLAPEKEKKKKPNLYL